MADAGASARELPSAPRAESREQLQLVSSLLRQEPRAESRGWLADSPTCNCYILANSPIAVELPSVMAWPRFCQHATVIYFEYLSDILLTVVCVRARARARARAQSKHLPCHPPSHPPRRTYSSTAPSPTVPSPGKAGLLLTVHLANMTACAFYAARGLEISPISPARRIFSLTRSLPSHQRGEYSH